MRLSTTDSPFPWHKLPDSPDLVALRFLLDLLPDQRVLATLRAYRGKGRNDYPVHILWRVHVTRYLLRHPTMEACLSELGRNPALRRVLGIEDGQGVPEAWNMSRFLEVLGHKQHLALLEEMFETLAHRLGSAVADLGRNTAGDSATFSDRAARTQFYTIPGDLQRKIGFGGVAHRPPNA
ncbi:MAG: transposase [Planctomycetota bacterium]